MQVGFGKAPGTVSSMIDRRSVSRKPLARIIHAFVGMAVGRFVSSVGGGKGPSALTMAPGPSPPSTLKTQQPTALRTNA
jgi:hypothetical protein